MESKFIQPALPISYLYQPSKRNDVAIQFAPFTNAMQIHRKASEESGLRATKTVCGLALPDQWGEWAAMGSFEKHCASSPDSICEDCK